MGGFSNFAISFSIISILTGAVTLFGYGLEMGGPLEMTLGWPIATIFTLAVAASMAELCSAYPTVRRDVSLGGGAGRTGWAGSSHGSASRARSPARPASTTVARSSYCRSSACRPRATNTVPDVRIHPAGPGLLNHYGLRLVAMLNDFSVDRAHRWAWQ